MRRKYTIRPAIFQGLDIAAADVKAIRIQHQRQSQLFEQAIDQLTGRSLLSETRADSAGVLSFDTAQQSVQPLFAQEALITIRHGPEHHFSQFCRHHRIQAGGKSQITESGAAAQAGSGGECRSAAEAKRTGHHHSRAHLILMSVSAPQRQSGSGIRCFDQPLICRQGL